MAEDAAELPTSPAAASTFTLAMASHTGASTTPHVPYRPARSLPGRRNARWSQRRKVAADRTTM